MGMQTGQERQKPGHLQAARKMFREALITATNILQTYRHTDIMSCINMHRCCLQLCAQANFTKADYESIAGRSWPHWEPHALPMALAAVLKLSTGHTVQQVCLPPVSGLDLRPVSLYFPVKAIKHCVLLPP